MKVSKIRSKVASKVAKVKAKVAERTANVVQVTAATALDELRITFPAATSGKVRDFGLRVEIGTSSAALTAPALVPIAPPPDNRFHVS